ncbi:MAG: hypothetical protein KGI97_08740, partial [Alphaproteobacteria bacterium]|nr:hypothetical protein [Alphaproteobacteria bacterium]
MNFYAQGIEKAENGEEYGEGNLFVYPVVPTTMPIVDDMIADGRAERIMHETGTDHVTVIALKMTHGVGSSDSDTGKTRTWWANANQKGKRNLLFSRALRMPKGGFAIESIFTAAVTVAEIVADLVSAPVTIKYPNDVLVDGAKICGCLVESKYQAGDAPGSERFLNLGVAVNINVTPPQNIIRERAAITAVTSLADYGAAIPLHEFLEAFDRRYAEI